MLFLRANFPYTASLLLAEILEICSSEGQESAGHSALLWESGQAWLCVCVSETKGIIIIRANCHSTEKTNTPNGSVFVVFCFAFPSHRDCFLSSHGLPRKTCKIPYPRALLCIRTNFMLNKVLKGNVDHVCIKRYYLQLPYLVSPLKIDCFITLSTLSLFSMTLTVGGVQLVCLKQFFSCQPQH